MDHTQIQFMMGTTKKTEVFLNKNSKTHLARYETSVLKNVHIM